MEFTAEIIADFLKGEVVGDKGAKVTTVARIEEGKAGALSFLANPKYEQYIYDSESSVIIVNRSFEPKRGVKATLVKVDDAYSSFAQLLHLYESSMPKKSGVSDRAVIDKSATLGKNAYVGEFTVIGAGVKIGDNCQIFPQVYIGDRVTIGDNVTIQAGAKIEYNCVVGNSVHILPGAAIGADGFGFAPNEKGEYTRIPQIGNVVLEDFVTVGANTCIDRATFGSTVIKKGVKLDNMVQIAHNVVLGEHTAIAAQTGIAGSTKIGKNVMVGGQVGIIGHLVIGDRVKIASQSGIGSNLKDGTIAFGSPFLEGMGYHRSFAVFRNLPQMSIDIKELKKQIEELSKK